MTGYDFTTFADQFMSEQCSVLSVKGFDYTHGTDDNVDRLSNFKQVARMLGLTPLQVWAVYFMKHVTAISTYARTGDVASEAIRSRFLDAANYALLGAALAEENVMAQTAPSSD